MEKYDIIKLKVLHYSLALERLASFALCAVLDIENIKLSKSLGNTSESLSFNQKVNLLIDYGAVEKEEKKILDSAMRVRNQFMHNIECITYQDVFNHLNGEEGKLRKIYKELFKNADNEINLEECVNRVFTDSMKIVGTVKGSLEAKFIELGRNDVTKKLLKTYQNNIKDKFDDLFNEILSNSFEQRDNEILYKRILKLYEDITLGSIKIASEEFDNQFK